MDLTIVLICIVAGIAISAVIMLIKKSRLKSVYTEHGACNYVRGGSLQLDKQEDRFLYSNIIKVPLPRNNSGGGRRR